VTATVVLCVGNPFRRDDGVAPAVAGLLRGALPHGVPVVELDGEPSRIVDAWSGAGLAIVVDATRSGAAPGSVRRVEIAGGDGPCPGTAADPLPATRQASSHGASLGEAVALGRAIGRLPGRLVLYAVEAGDLGAGPGLSDPVARAVPTVAARVRADAAASLPAPAGRPAARPGVA
jgi:hydrogenase maturation protease